MLIIACGCQPAYRPVDATVLLSAQSPSATPAAVGRHIDTLADPARGGRMVGTPGNVQARQYIVQQFQSVGLVAGARGGQWVQPFEIEFMRAPGEACMLKVPSLPALQVFKDFAPVAAGCSGSFEGEIVFVGYGQHASDFTAVDAKGKVVLLLQGTAAGVSKNSLWWSKNAALRDMLTRDKLKHAAKAGARAVLLVTPPQAPVTDGEDALDSLLGRGDGPLPAMRISRALARDILKQSPRRQTLEDLAAGKKPLTAGLGARVSGNCDLAPAMGQNVIGVLPAPGGPDAPALVVGAHYDHLPSSGQRARDAGLGVRPGADDNASGIAALIETARAVAVLKERKCTYVFIAFDAEEFGLLGSKHYVNYPVAPLHRTAAMINFDQIGAVKDAHVTVIGNCIRQPFRQALAVAELANRPTKVHPLGIVNRTMWSDQAPFNDRNVPTLFFFGRFTDHYHCRTDRAETVNMAGVAQVTDVAVDVLRLLDDSFAPGP
ncbi:MAG: M20/M25/M40 family metallo-hydrolase [Planctomycetaceae bacterium]|nr:M28 family peptidase [Planctomycetaceae bacterium]